MKTHARRSAIALMLAAAGIAAAQAASAQSGSTVASHSRLGINDPTSGNIAGLGPIETGLGHAPNPASAFTYDADVNVIRMMNRPATAGDAFYNGTLRIENDAVIQFQHGGKRTTDGDLEVRHWPEGLVVMGDLLRANDPVTVRFDSVVPRAEYGAQRRYSDLNYVYVDGKISMGSSQLQMGTDHLNPINLYAGSVHMDSDRDAFANWCGDLYLHDPQGVSKFMVGKSGASLVPFVSNNIEKPDCEGNYMGGNVFCNNKELTIMSGGSDSAVSIGGDIIMSNPLGHLIIDLGGNNQSLVVGGSVVCAGKLTVKSMNWHNFKAIGGIYVDPSKVTFDVNNGKINDVAYDNTGAAFVRANFAKGFTARPKTAYDGVDNTISHRDSDTAERGAFCNTATYAYIQSLGVEAAGTTTYDDTFKKIRTNARSRGYPKTEFDEVWSSDYLADLADKIGNGYENYDYSLYPYCSRWDQIFEKYVRWDVSVTATGFDYDLWMRESEASGRVYGNYQPIAGGKKYRACAPVGADYAFIPVRVYAAGNLVAGTDYFNSKSQFSPYPVLYDFPSTDKKEVTIGTHKGDGSYDMPKKTFYVIEDSCVIDLADLNDNNSDRLNIFINPEGKSTPIDIILRNRVASQDHAFIVVNNTVKYDVSGGSFDYTNAGFDKTYTKLKMRPGREQVRIFFEKRDGTIGGDKFSIYCTGAYGQFEACEIHAIGNPYYPGTGEYTAAYGDIDSVTPTGAEAYAHELVPNVRVYAEEGATLRCINHFFVNAELLMPEGTVQTGTDSFSFKVHYKEYPNSEEVLVEQKYLFVLGSSCVQTMRANDAQGIAVCLGDEYRNQPPPVSVYSVTVEGGSTTNSTARAGATVTVTANEPEDGWAFVQWAMNDDVNFADASAAETTFSMPAKDVTVQAVCSEILIKGLDADGYPWTGNPIEPEIKVEFKDVDIALQRGTDYEVSYTSNTNAGAATVTVTMLPPRTGSRSASFTILPQPFATNDIRLADCEVVYDGKGHTIGIATNAIEGLELRYAAGDGGSPGGPALPFGDEMPLFTDVCEVTVWVEASAPGYFTETNSATVKIVPRSITNATVVVDNVVFTGVPAEPEPVVTDGDPSIITTNDYTVAYAGNDAPGEGTVTLTGTGNYTGTTEAKFRIGLAELTAELGWKYVKATGTYFAQLKLTCTNGLAAGISDLKFLFADRVGADGKTAAALWRTPLRAANPDTTSYGGAEYRCVALDASLITAENAPVVYGVADLSADTIPVAERTIEMYVRRGVAPEDGNAGTAEVDDFVGCVVWTSGGEACALPVVAASAHAGPLSGLAWGARRSATLPSVALLNASLAVGVPLTDDSSPYCRLAAFSVDGGTIRGVVEVGSSDPPARGSLGANARVTVLGASSPEGPFAEVGAVAVAADGSFSLAVPEGARFFKLRIDVEEVVK